MIEKKLAKYAKFQIDKASSYSEGMRQGYIQAKSEWQDLTLGEFLAILCDKTLKDRPELMMLEVESKLKEKNT
jgi:hypothetical protein